MDAADLSTFFDEEKSQDPIFAPDDENANPQKGVSGKDIVEVVRINKAKVSFFFTERVADVARFFEDGEIEFRITLGKNWNTYIAVNKTPLLKHFQKFEFTRNSECHYTRNLLLFSDTLQEGINMRMTLGVALDK